MRKLLKRYRLFSGLLTFLLAACTNAYPGLEYTETNGNQEQEYVTPITVALKPQDLFSTITTGAASRGTGSFHEETMDMKATHSLFHVFAFRSARYTQGGLTSDASLAATMSSDGDHGDCLIDGGTTLFGHSARLENDSTGMMYFVDNSDTTKTVNLYYSKKYQEVPYHFFAYYLDDFQPTTATYHRSSSEIYYDLKVDGSQDIMVGMAPDLTFDVLADRYKSLNLSDEVKSKIVNIGGYSAYSGRYDVYPIFDLKHVLTKLKFYAVPGDSTADEVTIRKVSVTGPNQGRLVVAASDVSQVGLQAVDSTADLVLRESSADGVTPGAVAGSDQVYQVHWADSMSNISLADRASTRIGESIMLLPGAKYTLHLEYNVKKTDASGPLPKDYNELIRQDFSIEAPHDAISYDAASKSYIFKAGYEYVVKFAVYGLKQIRVAVDAGAWKESDETIDINDEDYTK
ncbi:MAG: hypothetical protein PUD15_09400 [Prevotella sp.]|nr:hypothetical protein [Prevotella sp.]